MTIAKALTQSASLSAHPPLLTVLLCRFMKMTGRRIRLRAKRRSLSFLEISPTKRRKIRRKNISLTVARRLPNVSASSELPRTTAAGSRDREGKDTYLPPADSSVVQERQ